MKLILVKVDISNCNDKIFDKTKLRHNLIFFVQCFFFIFILGERTHYKSPRYRVPSLLFVRRIFEPIVWYIVGFFDNS